MKLEIRYCLNCRFPISASSDRKVCPRCGTPYDTKKPAKKARKRKPKAK